MDSEPLHTRGFTLLEVLMAGAMLAVAALGLGASLLSAANLQTNSQDRARVLGIARAELDYARTAPLGEVLSHLTGSSSASQLDGGAIVSASWAVPGLRGTTEDLGGGEAPGMISLQRVSSEEGAAAAMLVAIKVQCDWTGASGQRCRVLVTGRRRM